MGSQQSKVRTNQILNIKSLLHVEGDFLSG